MSGTGKRTINYIGNLFRRRSACCSFYCRKGEIPINKETIITAIASVIAFILLTINTIAGTNFDVGSDVTTSIATLVFAGVMWFISHYWNQDYTATADKFTRAMRKAKKLAEEGDATLEDLLDAFDAERSENDD